MPNTGFLIEVCVEDKKREIQCKSFKIHTLVVLTYLGPYYIIYSMDFKDMILILHAKVFRIAGHQAHRRCILLQVLDNAEDPLELLCL